MCQQLNNNAILTPPQDLRCRWTVTNDKRGAHLTARWVVNKHMGTPERELAPTSHLKNEVARMRLRMRFDFVGD